MFLSTSLSIATAAKKTDSGSDAMVSRYQRAAEIQQSETRHWALNATVTPHWIAASDEFWYERQTAVGHRFIWMNATTGAKSDALDHEALATALARQVGKTVDAQNLPIKGLWIDSKKHQARFMAFGKRWTFENASVLREDLEAPSGFTRSPDGKQGIFSKDQDLWVREFSSGSERRLTTDGETHYSYGSDPDAQKRAVFAPKVIWSPDSTRIFTAQTDDRQVLDVPLVDFAPKAATRPTIVNYREALPGDVHVPVFRLTIIDAATGRQTPVKCPPIPAIRMNDSPMGTNRMWWSADGRTAYFVDIERGEKTAHVEAVDSKTGVARTLFSETSATYLEIASDIYSPASIRPLPRTNQLIWYSERSGWAHLYLYDLKEGKMIRPLTHGNWLVRDILNVDEEHRQILVSIASRQSDRNPYYQEIARIDLNTGAMKILVSSDDDHEVLPRISLSDYNSVSYLFSGGDPTGLQGAAPSGNYFIDTVTTADKPSKTVLRDRNGREVAVVETADTSRMPSFWHWPTPVHLLAADGTTDIEGLVFRPSDYDHEKKYPVIDYIYGGPQTAYVPKGFGQSEYQDFASLAELGFIVAVIDSRGTPQRSRAFHTQSYGHLERASNLEDHIAAIQQLAAKDSSVDSSRVGITGFSAGGYATAAAMLHFPEFYQVGVAASAYDPLLFWNTWSERYGGFHFDAEDYRLQSNASYADRLKGKLLLLHGLLDSGVTPAGLFQLEEALIKANKDFDLLVLPQAQHQLPSYGKRRQWDYFVANLAQQTPPHEFLLRTDGDIDNEQE